jgi:hypothetical protein
MKALDCQEIMHVNILQSTEDLIHKTVDILIK